MATWATQAEVDGLECLVDSAQLGSWRTIRVLLFNATTLVVVERLWRTCCNMSVTHL